jgi:hypothetical protein
MAYLLGTDEAGYGPKLGPLVIAATLWRVPESSPCDDLYLQLGQLVTRRPIAAPVSLPIPIADSKTLYKSGGGLEKLEAGIFPALSAIGSTITRWKDVWLSVAPACAAQLQRIPWYQNFDIDLPVDADNRLLEQCALGFRPGLAHHDIQLLNIRARVVIEEQFNRLADQWGGKGALLSNVTMELISELLTPLDAGQILVHCDKHGGRDRYGPLLQQHFPEHLIEIRREHRSLSVYRSGPPSRRLEFRFAANGETFLPSALASMVAKYLRELAMKAFNHFWQQRVANLKPTAGYPLDARRFIEEIAEARTALKIPEHQIWRRC